MRDNQPKRLKILGMLFAMPILLALFTAVAVAASYPSKPLRLVVPLAPGGGNDIIGRLIAAKLTESLGNQVIVENRPGAGGVIGSEMVAKSAPDGYTLLIASNNNAIHPVIYLKLPYDLTKSFTPVARLATGTSILVVHPNVPANTLKELIALAKQKPGNLIFGCGGVGSGPHMYTELLKSMAEIDIKIVQFKGGGPAMIDLLGGHSQVVLTGLPTALPHIKAGKVRALACGGAKRSVILPEVPTMAEAGVPGYEATNWFAILAPAGTPAPVIDRLNRELKAILALDDVKKQFLTEGAEVDYMAPPELSSFLSGEVTKWARVGKIANIKPE